MDSLRARTLALVIGATFVAAGCNEEMQTSESRSEGISRSMLANALASAICDSVGPCCVDAEVTFDPAVCRHDVAAENQGALDRESDARPFDPKDAAACVDAVAAAARRCDMAKVYVGSRNCVKPHGKLGEPCDYTCLERTTGDACSPPTAPPAGDGGGARYAVSCYTNDSLYCDETGVCANQLGAGAACRTDDECRNEWCENGVCMSLVAEGGKCGEHRCAEGLYCDSWAFECRTLRSDGAACGSYEQCASGFCDVPGQSGGATPVVADAAPPTDSGTCALPPPSNSDPQYRAFVCGE